MKRSIIRFIFLLLIGMSITYAKKAKKVKGKKVKKAKKLSVGDEISTGEKRKLYDFSVSYECDCKTCGCGKGCTERCCSTCYTYYTYCAVGRYNSPDNFVEDGENCTACSAGQYQPSTGSTSCIDCPGNLTSLPGSGDCLHPTSLPTLAPIPVPTPLPSSTPTVLPTLAPSPVPTPLPTVIPTIPPSSAPSPVPIPLPTVIPTMAPSSAPSPVPTSPTSSPTMTVAPTFTPTACEDASPYCKLVKDFCETSFCPTCKQSHQCDVTCNFADCSKPTPLPSPTPTLSPSFGPSPLPTINPTPRPSPIPTSFPTHAPSSAPSQVPTSEPTYRPTDTPTSPPSHVPTSVPTNLPTFKCEGVDPAQYLMTLSDSGGNGWNGVYIALADSNDTEVFSTTVVSGDIRRQWVCLSSDCYNIKINSSDVEISWFLEDKSGVSVSGVAPTDSRVCTNSSGFANTPTLQPSVTMTPTSAPTAYPSPVPTYNPTHIPSLDPTRTPTLPPTLYPTTVPTNLPTENCVDGQYTDGVNCIACAPGKYARVAMATGGYKFPQECSSCEVGFYSRTGAASCLKCQEGKYSNLQRSDCVQCQSGQFVNRSLNGCQNCSAGQYAPFALNDACIECGPGSVTGLDEAATRCDDCDPGSYSVGDGVVNYCRLCPAGFKSNSRESSCTGCVAGTFSASSGSANCENCGRGKYSELMINSTRCSNCPAGQYSENRAYSCQVCPLGQYAPTEGTRRCLDCDSGKFADVNGSINCQICESGTFQKNSGQPSCVNCEVGKYVAYSGAKECTFCADGHVSLEGSAICDRCEEGYFWSFSKSRGWACEACPYGATCDGGLYMPVAKAGYWIDRKAVVSDPSLMRVIYKCVRDTCSKLDYSTRRLVANDDCKLLSNFSSPACLDDELFCAQGSVGPLCGACKSGWNFNPQERKCFPCGNTTSWAQAFSSMAIVFVFIVFLYSLRHGTIYVPVKLRRFTSGRSSLKIPVIGIFLYMNRAAVKLMVSTYQIVMSVGSNLEITFPEPYTTFGNSMGFVQLDFISLDCMKGSYYESVYTTCSFPILVVGIVWSIFALRYGLYKARMKYLHGVEDKESDLEVYTNLKTQHINISLMVVFVVLPPVAKKQFRALDCVKLQDGSEYLRDDTSIDCQSYGYKRFAFINVCFILFYQAIPLMYMVLLCRVREKLVPLSGEHESPEDSLLRRDQDKSLDPLRFLFNDTKTNRWYFEVLEFYRRIVFTGVLPLTSKDTSIIAYLGSLLGMFSVVYFRELLPFRTEFTNFIAVVCQYVILVVFLAALMIETDSRDDLFRFTDLSFGLFLVFVNVLILALVVYGGYLRYSDSLKKDESEKELKVDWAVHFTPKEFEVEIEKYKQNLSSGQMLVYYYTSLAEAEEIIRCKGIPALKLHPSLTSLTPHRPRLDMETDESSCTAIGERGGVIVSLKAPQEVAEDDTSIALMNPCAWTKEAVLCMALPKALLWSLELKSMPSSRSTSTSRRSKLSIDMSPVRGTSLDSVLSLEKTEVVQYGQNSNYCSVAHLRLLPVELLEAMGSNHLELKKSAARNSVLSPKSTISNSPTAATTPKSPSPLFKNAAFTKSKLHSDIEVKREEIEMQVLNSRCIQGAFQLKNFENLRGRRLEHEDFNKYLCRKPRLIEAGVVNMSRPMKVFQPLDYEHYSLVMKSVREACSSLNLVPLYCYTSHAIAHDIKQRGIHLTSIDRYGSGVFFTSQSPCSLGFGTSRFEKNVIEHLYGASHMAELLGQGMFDFVIVYGAEPYCIEKSWSSNRVIYGQNDFEDLIKTKDVHNFHLRRDRIMTALHVVNKEKIVPQIDEVERSAESKFDRQYKEVIKLVERDIEINLRNNREKRLNNDGDDWLFKNPTRTDSKKEKEENLLAQMEYELV